MAAGWRRTQPLAAVKTAPIDPPEANALVRELCAAVRDLGAPPSAGERAAALLRILGLAAVLLGGSGLYWTLPLGWEAIAAVLVAGVAYALLLVATHEMVHGTLLGQPRLEQPLACLLSWPMAWPYLTYSRLHRLHHRWNGVDGRDPERTTPLEHELQGASPLRRWLQRRRVVVRIAALAGVGLIAETTLKGIGLQGIDGALKRAGVVDGVGVVMVHAAMLTVAIQQGVVGRYLLFWLLLERVIGAIVQARGLVEHHDLWATHTNHLLTQLYGSRSVEAGPIVNALMGGLPHHSAHHAFPWIASGRLPLASQRIAAVLARHGAPAFPTAKGYGEALLELGRWEGG
jgi:fatty acid desaturase